MAGLILDPWEELVLSRALGERPDGKWSAFEIGVVVSRQNGKGAILEARELAGLFLLGERLIIHSAHQFDTSLEAFNRLLDLIDGCADLSRRVKRVSRSHGEEGITLTSRQRIRFRTRTKGGGRGFTADCLILDEAMELPEAMHGALLPTLSARPNPQVWYTGSAVDQEIHSHGIVFARVRERGFKEDPGLAFFEWSVDRVDPVALDRATASDPDAWAQANPGLGIRISEEHIAREQRSMDARTFAVERLGVGDWPRTDGLGERPIDPQVYADCFDENSAALDPVCFSFDVTPDRSSTAIGAAGWRTDGRTHGELVIALRGTGDAPAKIAELAAKHKSLGVVCDASGPAGSLLPELAKLGVKVIPVNAKEHAQACGMFYDAVDQRAFRHRGQPELASAIDGAVKRPLGDAWAWSRKNSTINIAPLVAVTLASWGLWTQQPAKARFVDLNAVLRGLES